MTIFIAKNLSIPLRTNHAFLGSLFALSLLVGCTNTASISNTQAPSARPSVPQVEPNNEPSPDLMYQRAMQAEGAYGKTQNWESAKDAALWYAKAANQSYANAEVGYARVRLAVAKRRQEHAKRAQEAAKAKLQYLQKNSNFHVDIRDLVYRAYERNPNYAASRVQAALQETVKVFDDKRRDQTIASVSRVAGPFSMPSHVEFFISLGAQGSLDKSESAVAEAMTAELAASVGMQREAAIFKKVANYDAEFAAAEGLANDASDVLHAIERFNPSTTKR